VSFLSHTLPQRGPDWQVAGFISPEKYPQAVACVHDTLNSLEEIWKLKPSKVYFKQKQETSWAQYATQELCFGMRGVAHSALLGYVEYATLQYLIGIKHRRGERRKPNLLLCGVEKSTKVLFAMNTHIFSLGKDMDVRDGGIKYTSKPSMLNWWRA